jgi:Cdc6-like AAA superfamily ATPase
MNGGESDPSLVGTGRRRDRGENPFSPTAIARVSEFDTDTVTIPTPAIREAISVLEHYLASQRKKTTATDHGNVIAIVGEHGTGKTHLVVKLLHHANESTNETAKNTAGTATRTLYLDAPAATFVTLYQRFIQKLKLPDVRNRVREYYADIVADALGASEFTVDVATGLRQGELDPIETIERLSLMESSFLQEVQRKLQNITDNEAFSTALTLLLRDGFDDAVWEWLSGHDPDQILMDRGITTTINSETAALEAMGVFALLYGHRNHRFIVAIDELDKILLASSRSDETAIAAFKKLLEVFAAARALLVLAGLPDYRDRLGTNVLQRIGRIIEISALTTENVTEFIRLTQQRTFGNPQLDPFTTDTVRYLVKLTDGTARKIIRLCHQLYRKAIDDETEVTDSMVREVARTQSNLPRIETVSGEVSQVLDARGLRYFRNHLVGRDPHSRADYWVRLGSQDADCAILLTESVLDLTDSERLTRRATSIRNAATDSETVLVVVGYLPSDRAAELNENFQTVLVYDHLTFNKSLEDYISKRTKILEEKTSDNFSSVIQQRLERMSRQQTNTQKIIERLAIHLDDWQSSADRQFATIRHELGEISNAFYATDSARSTGSRTGPGSPRRLPPEVDRLFEQAAAALGAVDRVDMVLHEPFTTAEQEVPAAIDPKARLRARLRSQELVQAMGVAVLLQKLVTAFRDSVNDWYRSYSLGDQGQLTSVDRTRLGMLCQTYDALYEYLPVFQLDKLERFNTYAESYGDPVDQTARPNRTTEVQEVVSRLGARIQSALLTIVSTPQ